MNKVVLDVGAGDVNGNNRTLFKDCAYCANDVVDAPNVTIVSKTKDLAFPDESFDTIISSECFEHDAEYPQSLAKILRLLKPGGVLAFTCASSGRMEHGTSRTSPEACFATLGGVEGFTCHYKNLVIEDINATLHLNIHFGAWRSFYNYQSKDLYFIGFKRPCGQLPESIPNYDGDNCTETTGGVFGCRGHGQEM